MLPPHSSTARGPSRTRLPLLAGVCLLVLACGASSRPGIPSVTGAAAGAKVSVVKPAGPRIAFIMKTMTNPFFLEMEKGAHRAQQETQADLQVRSSTLETSVDQQIQLVESEIKAGARAIVIAPGDSMRLVPALKKAQDAGIALVNIDNRLSPEAVAAVGMRPVPFISVDNEKGAYNVTRRLVERLHGPAEVALLEGIRTADNGQLRRRGAERAFKAVPGLRIVASETAHWKIDEAYLVTRDLFRQHPRVTALFCANDMMALGAVKYLQEAGRHDVRVAGFDAVAEARTAIRAGQMTASVDQQADQQGYLGVQTALKLLRGESVPMVIEVETVVVDAGSLK